MMQFIALFLAAQLTAVARAGSSCGTMIFPHSKQVAIRLGLHDVAMIDNDKAIKLRVNAGYVVQVFEHSAFKGERRHFEPGFHVLDRKWRTIISSYECLIQPKQTSAGASTSLLTSSRASQLPQACGTMFTSDYIQVPIFLGSHDLSQFDNDKVIKLQVDVGYAVQVFQHCTYKGESRRFERGVHELDPRWRTIISSYKCQRQAEQTSPSTSTSTLSSSRASPPPQGYVMSTVTQSTTSTTAAPVAPTARSTTAPTTTPTAPAVTPAARPMTGPTPTPLSALTATSTSTAQVLGSKTVKHGIHFYVVPVMILSVVVVAVMILFVIRLCRSRTELEQDPNECPDDRCATSSV